MLLSYRASNEQKQLAKDPFNVIWPTSKLAPEKLTAQVKSFPIILVPMVLVSSAVNQWTD